MGFIFFRSLSDALEKPYIEKKEEEKVKDLVDIERDGQVKRGTGAYYVGKRQF